MQFQKSDTKEKLTESFKELVLENGFEKIRIKEITDRVGLTRPTFYTYFQDKYEVVEYIFQKEIIEPMTPFLENGFDREAFLCLLVQMEKDKGFYRKISRLSGQNSFQEIMNRDFMKLLRRILEDKMGPQSHPLITADTLAEYFENIFQFVILKWLNLSEDQEIPPSEVIAAYDLIMSKPLAEIIRGEE